jgi:quinol monooxygenase YgiN
MLISNAYWTIVAGKQAEAEAALAELAREVEAKEPGTWMYLVHVPNRGVSSFPPQGPGAVTFLEVYKDRQAFLDHVTGPVFTGFLARHGADFLNMYGPTLPFMITEGLDPVAIFLRPEAAAPTLYTVIARWAIKPGFEDEAKTAIITYVRQVQEGEPETWLYSANTPDRAPGAQAFPPVSGHELVYNSGWKDHQAFLDHANGPIYQSFLAEHGHLFLQVNGAETTNQPYLTSVVLHRLCGFIRPRMFSREKEST